MFRKRNLAWLVGLIISVGLSISSVVQGTELMKVGYLDPYTTIMKSSNLGISPLLYWGQIDSCGLSTVLGTADSISTNNSFGVKYWGQDRLTVGSGSYPWQMTSLEQNVHEGHNIILEAEATQLDSATWGYKWSPSPTGPIDQIDLASCRKWKSPDQTADTILRAVGKVMSCKYERWVYPFLRLFVWNNTSADTLLGVRITYNHPSSGSSQKVFYLKFSDIPQAGSWQTIALPTFRVTAWSTIGMKVQWRGTDSLAIDKIYMHDSSGELLLNVSRDSVSAAFARYGQRINGANHERYYPSDEPISSQFYGQDLYDDGGTSSGLGHRTAVTLRLEYGLYARQIAPAEIATDNYPILYHMNQGTTSDTFSVQKAWDRFIAFHAPIAREMATLHTPWFSWVQSGIIAGKDTVNPNCGDSIRIACRTPSPNEMAMQVYLQFAYGARGIGYFTYASQYFGDVLSTYGFCDLYCHSEFVQQTDPCLEFYIQGLVEWNHTTHRYEITDRWTRAKEVNAEMDTLWKTLDTLSWVDANNWRNVRQITGSTIDSIWSKRFMPESTYIEIGRYVSPGGKDFYCATNRRTLAGGADSQTVSFSFPGRKGIVRLTDMRTGEIFEKWDSLGVRTTVSIPFSAAQLRLLRTDYLESWSGSLGGSMTVPQFATLKLRGDLTVPVGATLTLSQGSTVIVPANVDSTASGMDVSRTEMKIDGTLRIWGIATDSVKLLGTTPNCWTGIRSNGAGHVSISYAHIRNATYGLYSMTSGKDSVLNSWIESPYTAGLSMNNGKSAIQSVTVSRSATGYGLKGFECDSILVSDLDILYCKYPVSITWGTLVGTGLDAISFDSTMPTNGIACGNYSKVNLAASVVNYRTGVSVGAGAKVVFNGLSVYSHEFNEPVGDTNYMRGTLVGINCNGNTAGTLKVRNSCFGHMDQTAIWVGSGAVDLGQGASDPGGNNFYLYSEHIDSLNTWNKWPDTLVFRLGSVSPKIPARGNYWGCDTVCKYLAEPGCAGVASYIMELPRFG